MKNIFLSFIAWLIISCVLPIFACATNTSPVTLTLIKGGQKDTHIQAGLLLTIPKEWHAYAPKPP